MKVGHADGLTKIDNFYVKGKIINNNTVRKTAGLIVSLWYNSSLNNTISFFQVTNGNKVYEVDKIINTFSVQNQETRIDDKNNTLISKSDANEKIKSIDITIVDDTADKDEINIR